MGDPEKKPNSTDSGGHPGGMSRAAKKRAKKRQKTGARSSVVVKDTINDDNSSGLPLASNKNNKDEKEMKELRARSDKRKVRVASTAAGPMEAEEEQLMDEVHSSDDEAILAHAHDDDEYIAGGAPSKRNLSVSDQDCPAIPSDCHSLLEFLLLNDSNNCSSTTRCEFENMTSRQRSRCAIQFLLQPSSLSVEKFYSDYWEKQPLHISNQSNDNDTDTISTVERYQSRLDGFLSLSSIRNMLHEQTMYYTKDLNVTRYQADRDGVQRRVTLDKLRITGTKNSHSDGSDNEPGFIEAKSTDVWRHWDSGCTIRLLCPHKHSPATHALLSLLELEWGCMVGANAYLTPSNNAQGFAPHYDDIEAFILQLQGYKRWKVYAPLNKAERLPRTSSSDYTDDDLKDEKPVLDVILRPGDVLYMPRGWIHQACTLSQTDKSNSGTIRGSENHQQDHSLHLTVSAMQQWAWADLMEVLLPEALEAAASSETSTSLREGLPKEFLSYMGAMHDNRDENVPSVLLKDSKGGKDGMVSDSMETIHSQALIRKQELQEKFRWEAKRRIMRVAKEAMDMLDAACDQMGKRYMADRLPPELSSFERLATNQASTNKVQIMPDALCRLVRPGIARLVLEHDVAVLYHCADNSVVYQENPLSPMEFEMDDAPALEQLLTTVEPHWICVNDLFHDSIEDKISITQALFDEGILAIRPVQEPGDLQRQSVPGE